MSKEAVGKYNLLWLMFSGTPKTRASHAEANLLTLPAQLRNRIYQLVLIANYGTKRPDETYAIEIASPDTGDGF